MYELNYTTGDESYIIRFKFYPAVKSFDFYSPDSPCDVAILEVIDMDGRRVNKRLFEDDEVLLDELINYATKTDDDY